MYVSMYVYIYMYIYIYVYNYLEATPLPPSLGYIVQSPYGVALISDCVSECRAGCEQAWLLAIVRR